MSDIKRLKELYKLLRKVDEKMMSLRDKATDDKALADAMAVCRLANLSMVSFIRGLINDRED